jgi:hypothetical protein
MAANHLSLMQIPDLHLPGASACSQQLAPLHQAMQHDPTLHAQQLGSLHALRLASMAAAAAAAPPPPPAHEHGPPLGLAPIRLLPKVECISHLECLQRLECLSQHGPAAAGRDAPPPHIGTPHGAFLPVPPPARACSLPAHRRADEEPGQSRAALLEAAAAAAAAAATVTGQCEEPGRLGGVGDCGGRLAVERLLCAGDSDDRRWGPAGAGASTAAAAGPVER